jgi:hypothetical protein
MPRSRASAFNFLRRIDATMAADFINARPRNDTQLMWLRLRSTSSGAYDTRHSFLSRRIGVAHGRSEECPHHRLPRSRSFRIHHFAASIRLVRKHGILLQNHAP